MNIVKHFVLEECQRSEYKKMQQYYDENSNVYQEYLFKRLEGRER